jgi:hypothetical protein
MAKQSSNVVTYGLRGKIGDLLIFRQLHGQTVISKVPQPGKKASEKQLAHRQRFQRAVVYSTIACADPELSAAYKAAAGKTQSARNIAIADMLHAPDITGIDLSNYHGQPGDVITIDVTDDFAVKEVKVIITNSDGSLVEEGNAQSDASGFRWTYIATQTNAGLEGDRIEIMASDIPGNITRESQTL